MSHVFGPVPSRRLGFSLGIDPVVPKTCSMDCVYCELGRTAETTVCRARYVDPDEILAELEAELGAGLALDFVTFSGSGEPTLSSDLATLIEGVRKLTSVPVAVLTNGSLLTDPAVRSALSMASVVVPSLDAVSPATFERVNRPHPSLDPSEIIRSMASFTSGFDGEVWLETLIVEGMNDGYGEIELLAEAIRRIDPARVQVNTIVRPPADAEARPVCLERLNDIASLLGPRAEVVAAPSGPAQLRVTEEVEERIIEMATRRPVTVADVARVVGTSVGDAAKILDSLRGAGLLDLVRHGETLYYRAYFDRERP